MINILLFEDERSVAGSVCVAIEEVFSHVGITISHITRYAGKEDLANIDIVIADFNGPGVTDAPDNKYGRGGLDLRRDTAELARENGRLIPFAFITSEQASHIMGRIDRENREREKPIPYNFYLLTKPITYADVESVVGAMLREAQQQPKTAPRPVLELPAEQLVVTG